MTRRNAATSIQPYISLAEARARQEAMRGRVLREGKLPLPAVRHVAGVDCGFPSEHGGEITRAAVAVLAFPSLEMVEHAIAERPTDFPYIPGFLSFREVPTILDALTHLRLRPDLLIVDGQGYAHPRGFGIACHLGVETGIPSIGAGKSRLVGSHREPGAKAGSRVPLEYKGETVGAVLRTRDGVSPLYVSVGHKLDLDSAVSWVLACTRGYRLPETTRWADGLAYDPGFRIKPSRR